MTDRLKNNPPSDLAGKKVVEIIHKDGVKFMLEGGEWMMVRFSGTEPLMRCYMEARTPEGLAKLRLAGKDLTQV